MIHARRTNSNPGFTLIELLVVISIIALLISVLLPSLSSARRTGQRVACMANLREAAAAQRQYATDNNDWAAGAPTGSGAYLAGEGLAYGPAVQSWDWMGPLAYMLGMGLYVPDKGDYQGVITRFNQLRASKQFLCPSNKFLSTKFAGPDAGAGWMVSYNMSRYQLWQDWEVPSNHEEQLPTNWRISFTKIGSTANKVLIADGSRYATATVPPDYDLTPNAGFGGAFSDTGCYSIWSRSWDRTWATGGSAGVDARIYAYRHSNSDPPPGAAGGAYRLNLAFYDGHVETQGDLESTNPHQWLPQGTLFQTSGCWQDTIDHFNLSGTITIGP